MPSGRAIRAGRAEIEISTNDKYVAGLKRAQRRMRNFQRSANNIGASLGRAALGGGAIFGLSAKVFAEFDDRMRVVRAVTGATEAQFRSMTDEARRLGATTSFSAREVANAMAELGRAGFTPDQIEVATKSILNLARATDSDLPRSAEIAGAALRQFGLDVSEMGRVVDVLTATTNGSAQTLEDLFEAMKPVGPIASSAGESIEDTAAALGILANNGIKGSLAGNALARAYKNLSAELGQKKIAAYGVAVVDANGDLRKMADIINDLAIATKDLGSAARLAAFEELFGRGAASAIKLAESGEAFVELAQVIKDAGGVAALAAKEMDAGLGGAFRRLKSATEAVGISIGKAIEQSLIPMVDNLTKGAAGIENFVRTNEGLLASLAKVTLAVGATAIALFTIGAVAGIIGFAIGGIATILGTLGTVASLLLATFTALGTALVGMASPIGLAIGLFVGLGTVIEDQTGAISRGIAIVFAAVNNLAAKVAPAIEGIKKAIAGGDVELALKIVAKQLEVIWVTLISELKKKWVSFVGFVQKALLEIPQKAGKFLNQYITDFAYGLAELGIISDKQAGRAPQIGLPKDDTKGAGKLIDAQTNRQIEELDKTIDKLNDELKKVLEEEPGGAGASGDGGPSLIDQLKQALANASSSLASGGPSTPGGSSRGTFGANAFFGFGGGERVAERTAKAAEATAENTKAVEQAILNQPGIGRFA